MLAQLNINLDEVAFLLAFPVAAILGVYAGTKGSSRLGYLTAALIGIVALLAGAWLYLDPKDTGVPELTLLLDVFGVVMGICYLFRNSLRLIGLAVLSVSVIGIALVGSHL